MALRYRRYRANNFRFTRQASVHELELTGMVALVALLTYFSTRVSMATLWIIFIFIAILGVGVGVVSFTIFRRTWLRDLRAMQVLGVIDTDQMEGPQFNGYLETLLKTRGYHVMQIINDDEGTLFIAKRGRKLSGIRLLRQEQAVGPIAVRYALHTKQHFGLQAFIIITTSSFTPATRRVAFSHRIGLIDRRQLARWILEFHENYTQ